MKFPSNPLFPLQWYISQLAQLQNKMSDLVSKHEVFSIQFASAIGLGMVYVIAPFILIGIAIKVYCMIDDFYDKAKDETKRWHAAVTYFVLTAVITCIALALHYYLFIPVSLLIYIAIVILVLKNKEKENDEGKSGLAEELGILMAAGASFTMVIMFIGDAIIHVFK